jgi:hypothetical protein
VAPEGPEAPQDSWVKQITVMERAKWAFWMELQPKWRQVARNTKYMSVHVLGGERRVLERET